VVTASDIRCHFSILGFLAAVSACFIKKTP
jgi:hypothetical protein